MRSARQRRPDPRIDLAPMVDVVFNLLIFFFVTTTFLTDTGIPLRLPESTTAEAGADAEPLLIRVGVDGAVRFGERVVSMADLETDLEAALRTSSDGSVTIEADGQVDYETIVKVMDAARRAKARGIVLATSPPPPPPAR